MMWLFIMFIIHYMYFMALIFMDMNDINSERNTISCGISFIFENTNKLIDLDLIITALDIYSFEDNQ